MKKPFIAILLAGFMVSMAEGPWAWAQTQPAPAPDAQAPAAAQQPLQAPPAGAPPNTPGATAPTPPPANPPPAPAPAQTPTPTQAPAPADGSTVRRRPGDLIQPSLRRTTGRTTRPPAAARPVPGTPGGAPPAPAAPGGSGSAPAFQAPSPTTGGGATGAGSTAGSTSPSTPNVNLPGANAEGVMELPGEKEFNQCKKVPPNKRILKFSFKPETEITDLIGWISAISCTQFLIGGTPVAGKKVTVISPQLITLEEAYRLFLGALESVQLTVEPMGKFLRIVDTSRARFSNLPFQKDGANTPESGVGDKRYVTRLFRFDHLDPNEVMNLYNQVRGEQGVAVAFQGSLIITDQSVMLDRFGEIVRELDQPSVIKEKIWMVRVRNTSATEMAGRLAEIFAVQQMGMGGRRPGAPGAPAAPVPPAAPGARAAQTVKRVDLASQLSITKLIPDERSNQLIVVANEQAYEWLLTIMKKLDVPIEGGGDGRFHIYYCEHANCDELAATLSAVTGVSVIGGVGARRTARTAVPGQAPPPPTPMPNAPGQQTGTPLFEGDVRVTFDAATNSLVVYSSLKDFQSLRRVIEKLDGPRKQVYVEAMILEVLLDKSRDLGIAYHGGIPTKIAGEESVVLGGFDAGKTLNPAGLAGDLVGLAGAVFGPALSATTSRLFGTQVDIPSFGAFIKLLQKNNDVNVLSTPHLLITNNQEGEISVGQRLPFPSGFLGGIGGGGLPGQAGAGGLGGLLGGTAVNREDVSLRMKLIPSVNEYNMIRLDVDVEISDLASPNFNGLGPATTKRTAKTPVVCKDQQTVIIGGLMSDRQSDTVSKIPVLGDIPVLGFFFRNTSKQMVKSNIIIALTPYVINDMEDLRRVAEKKMRERREFIERYSAVEDKADFDAAIDYRRKRGMLEEINRASREIDDEEAALRVIRERELQDESTPIEPPGQGRPRAGQPPGTGQVTPPPRPRREPEPEPARPAAPEKREIGQAPAVEPVPAEPVPVETPALPSQPVIKPVAVKPEP